MHTLLVHGKDPGAQYPFWGKDIGELQRNVSAAPLHLPKDLSASCRDLLSRLLCKSASQRMTIDEVRRHPWLRGHLPQQATRQQAHAQRAEPVVVAPSVPHAIRAQPQRGGSSVLNDDSGLGRGRSTPMEVISEEKLRRLTMEHRAHQQRQQQAEQESVTAGLSPSQLVEREPSELLAATQAAYQEVMRTKQPRPSAAHARPASARANTTTNGSAPTRPRSAYVGQPQQQAPFKSRLAGLMTSAGSQGPCSARAPHR